MMAWQKLWRSGRDLVNIVQRREGVKPAYRRQAAATKCRRADILVAVRHSERSLRSEESLFERSKSGPSLRLLAAGRVG
jgi:hypothetical protein